MGEKHQTGCLVGESRMSSQRYSMVENLPSALLSESSSLPAASPTGRHLNYCIPHNLLLSLTPISLIGCKNHLCNSVAGSHSLPEQMNSQKSFSGVGFGAFLN